MGTLRSRIVAQQSEQADLSLDVFLHSLILDHTRHAEQLVHLLQRTALRLGYEEVDVENRNCRDGTEENERSEGSVLDER